MAAPRTVLEAKRLTGSLSEAERRSGRRPVEPDPGHAGGGNEHATSPQKPCPVQSAPPVRPASCMGAPLRCYADCFSPSVARARHGPRPGADQADADRLHLQLLRREIRPRQDRQGALRGDLRLRARLGHRRGCGQPARAPAPRGRDHQGRRGGRPRHEPRGGSEGARPLRAARRGREGSVAADRMDATTPSSPSTGAISPSSTIPTSSPTRRRA